MIVLRSDQQGEERTVPHYCRHRPQRSIQLCKASCTLFGTRLIEALLWIPTTTASFNEIQWLIAETQRLTLGCIFEQMQTSEGSCWTANSKTFTAIDIRFVSPKGQDFIRQERVTKPGDPYSTIFSKWNTGHSPVSNEHQYMKHITQTRLRQTSVWGTQNLEERKHGA